MSQMTSRPSHPPRASRARRGSAAVAVLAVLCLALAAALFALWSRADRVRPAPNPLDDPQVRDAVIAQLTASTASIWDSHNDPWVGRVLQPNISGKIFKGVEIRSNSFGMREKQYALPKPRGLVRVVILGDSLVFGEGCPQEERMGHQLEQLLRTRAVAPHPEVEVLHIAVASWNILNACEYLRRNLSDLAPDLVVHVTTLNDLDDGYGVRGFGEKARFDDLRRERADSLIWVAHPKIVMGLERGNLLNLGYDWESRTRYTEALAAMRRLEAALNARGAPLLHLMHWGLDSAGAYANLFRAFEPARVAVLPHSFWARSENWVSSSDPHWNPRGMGEIAELLYAWIRDLDALPGWTLPAEPSAEALLAMVRGEGSTAAKTPIGLQPGILDGDIRGDALAQEEAAHFYGGVDELGRLGPHASMLLLGGGGELLVELRGLELPELEGLEFEVYLEEFRMGVLAVSPGELARGRWPIEGELARRLGLNLRLVASDYAHVGPNRQHCVAAQLVRAAVLGRKP